MNVIFETECRENNCICTFANEEFDGFRFNQDHHRFEATCDDCGSFMVPVGYQGVIECSSDPFDHPKLMLMPEDYPPFFGDDEEY